MSKKIKVIILIAIVAIVFLLVGQVMGVQIGALYTQQEIHDGKTEEKPAMADTLFGGSEFSVILPEGWESDGGRAWNQNNPSLFITGGEVEVADNNTKAKGYIESGKVREFEMDLMASMCRDTDACGEISDFKAVKAPEGVQNFEFFVTYQGTGIDQPQGFTTELHRTVLAKGKLYRFWTSTDSSAGKNAGEFQNFRSIVDTFELK